MIFLCVTCGRNILDHTIDEAYNGCQAEKKPAERPTASLTGYVNPEALESTGATFDLDRWRNDFSANVIYLLRQKLAMDEAHSRG